MGSAPHHRPSRPARGRSTVRDSPGIRWPSICRPMCPSLGTVGFGSSGDPPPRSVRSGEGIRDGPTGCGVLGGAPALASRIHHEPQPFAFCLVPRISRNWSWATSVITDLAPARTSADTTRSGPLSRPARQADQHLPHRSPGTHEPHQRGWTHLACRPALGGLAGCG